MNHTGTAGFGRDPDAFEAFYREHLPFVRSFVARRVDDPHTAADLTADIFLAAIQSADTYQPGRGRQVAWLVGIARNVVAGHLRSKARELRAMSRVSGRALLDDASIDRIAQRIDVERTSRQLYRALDALPQDQRAVVELVALDGLSLVEAADLLGITPGAARTRYHRARTRLQSDLVELTTELVDSTPPRSTR
ncbi:MAG: sigma-70 family RNA polymerase sigma factor [Actinomycetia bacterium]|nr:sigma-70 family RNA polymerase sigma factor [Actinomycetes bacterium]